MGKTVMVVDDSGSFRTVVKLALQKAGYAVVEAVDGQDAADKLNAAKPNLIVCDVNMPRMDGLTFARHVKASSLPLSGQLLAPSDRANKPLTALAQKASKPSPYGGPWLMA